MKHISDVGLGRWQTAFMRSRLAMTAALIASAYLPRRGEMATNRYAADDILAFEELVRVAWRHA